jgi:predicted GNAT superfamily acetyltransferase
MPNTMTTSGASTAVAVRDLASYEELSQVPDVEKEVWGLSEADLLPMTFIVASHAAGNLWLGAFDGNRMIGFAFGILGREQGRPTVHSHMLAVLAAYRDRHVGHRLKLVQRDRTLGMGIPVISWTFDPLQGKNAHLNFARLGVVSSQYKTDFYGPQTSSDLHRNGTDRLWVEWLLDTRRVNQRLAGSDGRRDAMDSLRHLLPLVQFNGAGRPARTDLAEASGRQRVAIEIPGDIAEVERQDMGLARLWREDTRWAFCESMQAGFVVTEFVRSVRGQQGPGVYLLEKRVAGESEF